MKKTIILILVLLPIVLLMIIAVAGKILSIYQHISVESVEFVDRVGNPYTDDLSFEVAQGGTKETRIKIYPELASNKNVTYSSSNTDICTVDENGVITGVHYGTATVTVKTKDNSKTAMLNVLVKADVPFAVYLSETEKTLIPGGSFTLTETVDAPVAMDKYVSWSSSDEAVATVDSLGNVKAIAPGEAFITATTRLGGKTASCKVTVPDVKPPIEFNFENVSGVTTVSGGYLVYVKTLNLLNAAVLGEGVTVDDITLSTPDTDIITIDGWTVTVNEGKSGPIKLVIKVNIGGDVTTFEKMFLFN